MFEFCIAKGAFIKGAVCIGGIFYVIKKFIVKIFMIDDLLLWLGRDLYSIAISWLVQRECQEYKRHKQARYASFHNSANLMVVLMKSHERAPHEGVG